METKESIYTRKRQALITCALHHANVVTAGGISKNQCKTWNNIIRKIRKEIEELDNA